MRALAEFIMRGRAQASIVAFFGNLLPLISPATVGLVALRLGLSRALLILLWSVLPSLLAFYISDTPAMLISASIATVVVLYLTTGELKRSASWANTLLLTVGLSGLAAVVLNTLFASQTRDLIATIQEVMAEIAEAGGAEVPKIGASMVLALISYVIALSSVASLLLARWWQAQLYNPGGFQSEFHQLRLVPKQAVGLVVGMIGCYVLQTEPGQGLGAWIKLLELPLMTSGIALVHFTVKAKKLGGHWLALLYAGLIMLGPIMSAMLVGLGCIDSVANLRNRMRVSAN